MIIRTDFYTRSITSDKNIGSKYGSVWGRNLIDTSLWTRLSGGFNIPEVPAEALPVTLQIGGYYTPGLTYGECFAFVTREGDSLSLCYRTNLNTFPCVEVYTKKKRGKLVFVPIEQPEGFHNWFKPEDPQFGAKNWLVAPNGAIVGRTSRPGKKCEICQRHFEGADMQPINDGGLQGFVCPNCAYEVTRKCSQCGKVMLSHNAIWDYNYHDYICSTCKMEQNSLTIHGYHWKPEIIFYGNKNDLHLGIELEAGGTTIEMADNARRKLSPLSKDEHLFHLEKDSSVPKEGFELVTQPCTAEFHKNEFNWEAVMDILNENKFKTGVDGRPCGMHIHLSRNYMSSLRWCVLDWFVYQNRFLFEAIANRKANRYAKFPNEKDKKWGINVVDRYEYLNFENEETVEFRLCKSTTDANRLINTVEYIDSVVNFVKNTKSLEPSFDEFETFLKKRKPLVYKWAEQIFSECFS